MNQEIIKNLKIIAENERLNKNTFGTKAYEKVIDNIELYDKEIKTPDDIKNIKGVGKGIGEKLTEFLTTGKIKLVSDILQDEKYILGQKLLAVYGIGPAKVDDLLNNLKITSFEQIKDQSHVLLNDKQRIGIKYYDDLQQRIPIAEGKEHHKLIKKSMKQFDVDFEMVGSFRRKAKDMGDIDILIKDNPVFNLKKLISDLKEEEYIIEVLASGKNKFMGICKLPGKPARRIDILVADPTYYYFALLYFTGSYNFNIYMRRIALEQGLSLSEYGFKDNKTKQFVDTSDIVASEKDIFEYLNIPYVQPNKR
jgi:DNA polymerase beta